MFQRETAAGKLLGYGHLHKHVYFFFGARNLQRDDLYRQFPEYDFAFLKQVHGTAVVEARPPHEPEADAHFTRMATRALVIQTADCVPILLASKYQVAAIHAGWRGVADHIIDATAAAFKDQPVLFAAIGPHIGPASFEVGLDVAERLCPEGQFSLPHSDTTKRYVDLEGLVRTQLSEAFGSRVEVLNCAADTVTDLEFHSFRRDGKQAGRQLSFVVLNS